MIREYKAASTEVPIRESACLLKYTKDMRPLVVQLTLYCMLYCY